MDARMKLRVERMVARAYRRLVMTDLEQTEEKREITCLFVSPENIRERLDPYFY